LSDVLRENTRCILCAAVRAKLAKKNSNRASIKKASTPTHPMLLKIYSKFKLMKIFFAKSDSLQTQSPVGFIQVFP